jgi:DNA-binding GntR family transcriptional regulator
MTGGNSRVTGPRERSKPPKGESRRVGFDGQALVVRIVESILADILSGKLPLGGKIKEKTLAESLGVSRGPLREAIRNLEGRGLIARVPNLGPRVISLSTEDVLQLYVIREALEGMCARLATELMSDSELQSLKVLVQQQLDGGSVPPVASPSDADLDFHQRLIRGARNGWMERIMEENLYDLIRIYRARFGSIPGRGMRSIEEHRDVVAAMLERDAVLAESLMRRHIRNARQDLMAHLPPLREDGAASAAKGPRRPARRSAR